MGIPGLPRLLISWRGKIFIILHLNQGVAYPIQNLIHYMTTNPLKNIEKFKSRKYYVKQYRHSVTVDWYGNIL